MSINPLAGLNELRAAHQEALALLDYALHLRTHGERAPGGDETWAEWERRTEAYLRGVPDTRPDGRTVR